jgi:hypothetical protein
MHVIKWFKVVEIQEHQGAAAPGALARVHGLIQAVGHQALVRQVGQDVIKRQLAHLLFA